jgi:phosphate transport system permease protein
VGQTVATDALLSDEADLYLKGHETAISTLAPTGRLTLTAEGDGYAVTSTAGDFAPVLAKVKAARLARAEAFEREAQRLRAPLDGLEQRMAEAAAALAVARAGQDAEATAAAEARATKAQADFTSLEQKAVSFEDQAKSLRASASAAGSEILDDNSLSVLIAAHGGLVKLAELGETVARGEAIIPLGSTAPLEAASWRILTYDTPAADRRTGDKEVAWLEKLRGEGLIASGFNWLFFTAGDSREPELAGIRGALVGSLLTLFVTLVICLPIGVGAAIYLEEFAAKNRLTEFIEVNINNLAAVPSIVFGLLGLAMFLNAFGLPRSAALVGGLVLALLVLPTIIIASRAALKAVPPSIKEAALGVGASHQQAVFHHVLPLALPGIMTGTIIGMAHALGETAPLLMIGMVAFIVDVPGGFTDAATALPVQIFLWSDLPEIAFQAKTAAAIVVLLLFLFVMNGAAIVLRSRFQRRW